MISLQVAYALERAAGWRTPWARPSEAGRDRRLADSLRAAARARAWDAGRGLFRDAPDTAHYSQQTNIMAVLVDAVPPADQRALMERLLTEAKLTQSTYYYGFYLLEALRKAGLGDRYIERLEPWRGMLAMGLTTVPENPEPTRSDSHAWSAHPNYGLLATVLGVRPDAPGFRSVRIAPHLGPLQRAEGRMPHPLGDIEVRLVRSGASRRPGGGDAPRGPDRSLRVGGGREAAACGAADDRALTGCPPSEWPEACYVTRYPDLRVDSRRRRQAGSASGRVAAPASVRSRQRPAEPRRSRSGRGPRRWRGRWSGTETPR